MGRILLVMFTLASFCSLGMDAQRLERVTMKDGTTLEGYTLESVPGKSMKFTCEVATVILTQKCISSIMDNSEAEVSTLSEDWQEWAKDNADYVKKHDGKSYLTLSNLTLTSRNLSEQANGQDKDNNKEKDKVKQSSDLLLSQIETSSVLVLERGAETKFVDLTKKTYNLNYADIDQIDVFPRPADVISGLVDIIEKKSGAIVEGQIVCHKINKFEKIMKDGGAGVEVIPVTDIKSKQTRSLNTKQTLFQQARFLDVLTTKNSKSYMGVIKAQVISDDAKDSHYLIQVSDNEIQRITKSDVAKVSKEINPNYKEPLTDIIVKNDSFYIWRKSYKKVVATKCDEKSESRLIVAVDSNSINNICVSNKEDNLVFECINSQDNLEIKLLKVDYFLKSKPTRSKPQEGYYYITYQDFAENNIKTTSEPEVSPNNTLRREYKVTEGIYVLYRSCDKQCVVFRIKKQK